VNIKSILELLDDDDSIATTAAQGLMSKNDKLNLNTLTFKNVANVGKVWKVNNSGDPTWGEDSNTTYSVVSTSAAGLAPALPNDTTNKKYLRQDGTWAEPPNDNTTYSTVSKTAAGLAPILPSETTTEKYLRQDATWVKPPNDNTTYEPATTTKAGLMSADDKKKLDKAITGTFFSKNYLVGARAGELVKTDLADLPTTVLPCFGYLFALHVLGFASFVHIYSVRRSGDDIIFYHSDGIEHIIDTFTNYNIHMIISTIY
jgi:hypothetical protein